MALLQGKKVDFIVIGAMRCGTTTFFKFLQQHPDIGVAREKETNFFCFDRYYCRGEQWYHSLYYPGSAIYGDISVNYTKYPNFPDTAQRIYAYNPNVKLIYLVRDPVERIISHINHQRMAGRYRDLNTLTVFFLRSEEAEDPLNTSRYYTQLQRYLVHFPKEQILILDLADLSKDPVVVMQSVFSFIGADASFVIERNHRANDSTALSHFPPWMFRLSRIEAVRALKRRVPGAATVARSLLAQSPKITRSRALLKVGPEARAIMLDLLADDLTRFRAFTGRDFADWTD